MPPLGLVTLNDMKAKQEALVKEREKQLAKKEQSKELQLWVDTGLSLSCVGESQTKRLDKIATLN